MESKIKYVYDEAGASFKEIFLTIIEKQIDSQLEAIYDINKVNAATFHELGGESA